MKRWLQAQQEGKPSKGNTEDRAKLRHKRNPLLGRAEEGNVEMEELAMLADRLWLAIEDDPSRQVR